MPKSATADLGGRSPESINASLCTIEPTGVMDSGSRTLCVLVRNDGLCMTTLHPLFDQSRRAPRLAGRGLIKIYRYTLSPLVGFHCRHLPTCSEYGDEALDRYGLWAGGWMTLARLLRCQPFGTSGIDRVPEAVPPARWYLP